MSLNLELVQAAYRLTRGSAPSDAEARRIAGMLDSREELLAALLVEENVFASHPELKTALAAVAKKAYTAARTPRTEQGDLQGTQRRMHQVDTALFDLIAAEKERRGWAEAAHEALGAQVRAWPLDLPHPGYHLCVAKEG